MELMQASRQWATRPSDERFTSLPEMRDHFRAVRDNSKSRVIDTGMVVIEPAEGDERNGLQLRIATDDKAIHPTHFSFGQLSGLAKAPAGYLRSLPAPLAADNLNYGLRFSREIDEIGVLSTINGTSQLRAATGPRYGRIWNADILTGLVDRFGDGISGDWKVPGEFGKDVAITKSNTTLFAGDRDVFIFLADEKNRIEIPGRRAGQHGTFARGFFLWNSEVGSCTFGLGKFLFDYACCNRIVWGAEQYEEIVIRHTSGAPERWADEVVPQLEAYAHSSTESEVKLIEAARQKKIDAVEEFLAKRFGKKLAADLQTIHVKEESRPIETLWDATTAATAFARGIQHQDARVALERQAGEILGLAA